MAVDKNVARSGFDLIILDLDMPIMNGYEACKKIRGLDAPHGIKDILIIDKKMIKKGSRQLHNNSSYYAGETTSKLHPAVVALSALVND